MAWSHFFKKDATHLSSNKNHLLRKCSIAEIWRYLHNTAACTSLPRVVATEACLLVRKANDNIILNATRNTSQ